MVNTILAFIWLHWFADFFLQNDKMATSKSTSFLWLGAHCSTYGMAFIGWGWKFALLQAIYHFIVDAISSRVTSHLFAKGDRHNFFVVIGLDQALHITITLLLAKHMGII